MFSYSAKGALKVKAVANMKKLTQNETKSLLISELKGVGCFIKIKFSEDILKTVRRSGKRRWRQRRRRCRCQRVRPKN